MFVTWLLVGSFLLCGAMWFLLLATTIWRALTRRVYRDQAEHRMLATERTDGYGHGHS